MGLGFILVFFDFCYVISCVVSQHFSLIISLFPSLYSQSERKLNDNLAKPRKFLQGILKANGKKKATLHSFRTTFNNTLRDLGLSIDDRAVLLAHSSSETTKIYTHPNLELAFEYINKMPDFSHLDS